MSTQLIDQPQTKAGILQAVTEQTINAKRAEYLALKVNGIADETGLANVKAALKEVVKWRTSTDKWHDDAKAEYLEAGRRIDAESKRIKAFIAPIEGHLVAQRKLVEDELARIEAEKQEVIYRLRIKRLAEADDRNAWDRGVLLSLSEAAFEVAVENATEATRQRKEAEAKREAEEAERKRQHAAEAERQRVEAEKLKAERAEFARLKKIEDDKQVAERERIRQEQLAFQAERDKFDAEKRQRDEALLAAQVEADRIERDRLAVEQAKIREQEEALERAAREARAEQLKPLKEKIQAFADKVRLLVPIGIDDEKVIDLINDQLALCAGNIAEIGETL
jgi:hypothetical protein